MKKILVNVNEENLEKIRDEWAGMRGYCSSNSDIVNELMMSEIYKLKQIHEFAKTHNVVNIQAETIHEFGKFEGLKKSVPIGRKHVRNLEDAYKDTKK